MDGIFNSETASFVPETDVLGIGQMEKENFGLGGVSEAAPTERRSSISDSPLAGAMALGLPEEMTPYYIEEGQAYWLLNGKNEGAANGHLLLGGSGYLDTDSGGDLLTGQTEEMPQKEGEDLLTGGSLAIEKMVAEAVPKVRELLQGFAQKPEFEVEMELAFGNSYDGEKADVLKAALSEGDLELLPDIELVGSDEINGANGAFAGETETIYLAREFVSENLGDVGAIVPVILEEFGHYLDGEINSIDAPGDEGEILASFVLGQVLDSQQLQRLKTEDDWATINIDGLVIEIEQQATVSDDGGFEGSNQTLVLESPGGVPIAAQYEMFTIPDRFIIRYEGQNVVDTGFTSGSNFLQADIPPGNSNQVQVILATNDENTGWNYTVTTDLSILPDEDDLDPDEPDGPEERDPDQEKRNEEDGCEDCKGTAPGTSEVELHSGAVLETHELVPYQSLGTNRGLVLTYDSMRADPNQIVYFGFDNVAPDSDTRLIAELEVNGANLNFQLPGYQGGGFGLDGGEHFWSIPDDGSGTANDLTASLEVDMSNAPSGEYSYNLTSGLRELVDGIFTGNSNTTTGDFLVVNSINSPFGSGWGLAGWQELVENPDGSVLLIDGDGSQLLYEPPVNPGEAYVSPPGDFSTLERLADGTFQRTLKNQATYSYNAQNQLQLIEDRNGNQTRYAYDGANQLTEIVDPVGLTTTLAYTNGKVSAITDPAGRVTQMTYDRAGNLTQVTDPDGSQRTWEYDGERRMTAETDQRGNREQMIYGLAGRADRAILKDGREIDYGPVQLQGLYAPTATVDPINSPSAFVLDADPVASYVDANGKVINNVLDQMGQIVASFDEVGALPTVTRNEDNLIASQTDARGNVTSFSYDERGNLLSVVDAISSAANTQQSFTYDPTFSQLTGVTDELGRQTLYEVDPNNGNLLAITEVVGQVGGDDDLITRFTYTPQGLVDTITDALGRVTDNDYDSFGNLIQTTVAVGTPDEATRTFEYNIVGNRTASIDENGNRTEFEYDAIGRLSLVRDALGQEARYQYDPAGNLISASDRLGNITQYEYDPLDRQTKIIDALNQETVFEFDGEDNVISFTDALGRNTQYTFDARNRRTSTVDAEGQTTFFGYDSDDNLISVVDALSNPTGYAYDARNRLTATTDALGNVSSTAYDLVDNVIAETDALGRTTSFTYDDLDRQTGITDALGNATALTYDAVANLTGLTDALNRTTSFTYDNRDRQTSIIDALGNTIASTYDPVGNLTALTDALGRTTSFTYDNLNRQIATADALGNTTTFAYDANGNLAAETDALGRTTSFVYDDLERQTSVIDALGNTVATTYDAVGNVTEIADPLGRRTSFAYDNLNRQTAITDPLGNTVTNTYDAIGNLLAVTDPVGNATGFTYDALNRRISETNPLGASRNFNYDAVGNLIATTDANNRVRTFTYDDLDRQVAENWLDEAGNPIETIGFTYDAVDRLTEIGDSNSRYSYSYDEVDRLVAVDNAGTPGTPNVVLDYTYDAVDNLLSVADSIDGQTGGTNRYAYDSLDRLTSISQAGSGVSDKLVNFEYNAVDRLTNINRFADLNGTQFVTGSNYAYDGANRLTEITHNNNTSPVAFHNYSYDAASQITQVANIDGTTNYTYDDRSQVVGVNRTNEANPDESYSYDANGNRIASQLSNNNEIAPGNRLLSDDTYNYDYDNEGNLIRQTEIATGAVREYQWDYRNRLVAVVDKDSAGNETQRVDYTYDALNRRITKAVDGNPQDAVAAVVTNFVYDGDDVLLEFVDDDGAAAGDGPALNKRYLHGPFVDGVLAQEDAAGTTLWHLADGLGTVRDLVDNSGALVNHITYNSFGNVISQTDPTVDNRYLFTGREFDGETGLYYYRSRYYDPGIGRFLSEDPLGFGAGDSNFYRYVFNNPVSFTDPDGEIVPALAVALVIGAGGLIGGGINAVQGKSFGEGFVTGGLGTAAGLATLAALPAGVSAVGAAAAAGAAGGFTSSATGELFDVGRRGESFDVLKVLGDTVFSTVTGPFLSKLPGPSTRDFLRKLQNNTSVGLEETAAVAAKKAAGSTAKALTKSVGEFVFDELGINDKIDRLTDKLTDFFKNESEQSENGESCDLPTITTKPETTQPPPVNPPTRTQNQQPEQPQVEPIPPENYTIEKGDTLWDIAENLYGDPYRYTDLYSANANNLSSGDPNRIFPGETLTIPRP